MTLYSDMTCFSAHSYQESACTAEIEGLKSCCRKLRPEILKYSVHCSNIGERDSKKGKFDRTKSI